MSARITSHRRIAMPGEQRGQALVLALLLVAVGGIAAVALYTVSATAGMRVRLTHTADAVAYSGALAQARSLNLLAYINRAQVAHQVAMAHLVTLSSWAQYGQTQAQQSAARNPPSSLIRRLFDAAAGKAYAQARMTDDLMPVLVDAFQEHDEIVHRVLQQASLSVATSLTDRRHQMMWRVLRANYPEYAGGMDAATSARGPLQMALLADGTPDFLQLQSGHGTGSLRRMVEQAVQRYDFLRDRNHTRRNAWIVNDQCPSKRHELRRRGTTRLTENGHWSAHDTLSFHALRSNRWIGCHHREYPMGWGRNSHESISDVGTPHPPLRFAQQDFWRWVHEHTTWDLFSGRRNPLATAYASLGGQQWSGKGLPDHYDLNDNVAGHPLRFAIRLRHAISGGLAAGGIVSVGSAAEAYFAPPSQQDGNPVFATLFHPYWQARLTSIQPSDSSRMRQ